MSDERKQPQLLCVEAVASLAGISVRQVWAQASGGTFPKPRKLSPRRTRWVRSEVEAWVEKQVALSR